MWLPIHTRYCVRHEDRYETTVSFCIFLSWSIQLSRPLMKHVRKDSGCDLLKHNDLPRVASATGSQRCCTHRSFPTEKRGNSPGDAQLWWQCEGLSELHIQPAERQLRHAAVLLWVLHCPMECAHKASYFCSSKQSWPFHILKINTRLSFLLHSDRIPNAAAHIFLSIPKALGNM